MSFDPANEHAALTPSEPEPKVRYEFVRGTTTGNPILPEQWDAFLDELRLCGRRTIAAQRAGISYTTVHNRIKNDPDFALEVEVAFTHVGDDLLGSAIERAKDKSDVLMVKLLEVFLPSMFGRDRQVSIEVNHKLPELTAQERAALEPIKRRLLFAGKPGYDERAFDAEWKPAEEGDPVEAVPEP